MTTRPSTQREPRAPRKDFGLAAVCLLLAAAFATLTAGVGVAIVPDEGIRVKLPEEITVTMEDGSEVVLATQPDWASPWISFSPYRLTEIDLESHASTSIVIEPDGIINLEPGTGGGSIFEYGLPVRGRVASVDSSAESKTAELKDAVGQYVAFTRGIMPEVENSRGELTAQMGTENVRVSVDDPTVRQIFPEYNISSHDGDHLSAWDVSFDLVAAHELGRTNLTYPLEWYLSPVPPVIAAVAPWLLGASMVGTVVFIVSGSLRIRRAAAADPTAWARRI